MYKCPVHDVYSSGPGICPVCFDETGAEIKYETVSDSKKFSRVDSKHLVEFARALEAIYASGDRQTFVKFLAGLDKQVLKFLQGV